jgi:hypothetical protein
MTTTQGSVALQAGATGRQRRTQTGGFVSMCCGVSMQQALACLGYSSKPSLCGQCWAVLSHYFTRL